MRIHEGQHAGERHSADDRAVAQRGVRGVAAQLAGQYLVQRVAQRHQQHQERRRVKGRRAGAGHDQHAGEADADGRPSARAGITSPSSGPESSTTISGARNAMAEASASGRKRSPLKNAMVASSSSAERPSCSRGWRVRQRRPHLDPRQRKHDQHMAGIARPHDPPDRIIPDQNLGGGVEAAEEHAGQAVQQDRSRDMSRVGHAETLPWRAPLAVRGSADL